MEDLMEFNKVTYGLPVETFRVEAYIAMEERLPVVTEFVLRLLNICDRVPMTVVRDYFGFSDAETLSVVESLSRQGLLEVVDDEIQLTRYSVDRFAESGGDHPRFSKVAKMSDTVTFDLISFTPVRALAKDIPLDNIVKLNAAEDVIGHSAERARSAYRKNYPEIASAREDLREKSYGVYSVESVESKRRSYIPVPVTFALDGDGLVVRKFDEAFEQVAPPELMKFVQEQVTSTLPQYSPAGLDGLREFMRVFDLKVMQKYASKNKFNLTGYLTDIENNPGQMPEGTRPYFGNLYLPDNIEMILAEINSQRSNRKVGGKLSTSLAWVAPDYALWGRGDAYADAVAELSTELRTGNVHDSVFLFAKTAPGEESEISAQLRVPHMRELHFSKINVSRYSAMEDSLEILLYPTGFMVAVYHLPLPGSDGLWAPIGFSSRLPHHVALAHELILKSVAGNKYGGKAKLPGHKGPFRHYSFEHNCPFLDYIPVGK